nr:MAG TPA: minor tail protein [Caudoviricetes sp.]
MVFKTLGTILGNFVGKSFESTIKDFKLSGGNIASTLFKSSDTIALQKFNQELKNGVAWRTAYNNTMVGTSEQARKNAQQYAILNARLKTYDAQLNANKIKQEEYNARVDATKAKMTTLGVETQALTIKERVLNATTKALAVGFQLVKAAVTTIGFTLIIAGITKLVNHLSDLSNNVEKTKEKVSSLTDEFNTAILTANNNAKRIEELIDKYDKLSDGVNNLGENISLTNEEYDEYKSLTNEIADMFPNLIQGYDNEGNAVLNLKGNVEQLRDAYKEVQQEAYNLLIATGKDGDGNDIIKQWQDTQDTNFWAKLFGGNEVGKDISVSEALKLLKTFEEMDFNRFRELPTLVSGAIEEVNGLKPLTDNELDLAYSDFVRKALGITDWNISEEDFTNAKKQANALIQTYNTEIESALSKTRSLANAYLNRNDDFSKLDESSQKAASVIVNSLDADIANQLTTLTAFSTFTDDIVNAFKNEDVQEAANSLFALDTSSMPVGEIISEVDKYIDIIANAIGEDSDKLKIRLGFDDTNETLERAKAKFKIQANSAMSGLQDGIYDFLENLSLSDLNIAMQIPDLFDDGLSKASEKIKEWKQNPDNNPASFDYSTYSEDVDKVAKNIDKVQSALDKLNSGKTVDNKDITELADAFPEYSTKILAASDDTEKLKAVLTEVKTNAPRSLIDTLSNLKDLSTDDQEAVNGLITMLESLGGASSTYADILNDLDAKQSLLSSAYKEMHDDGQISVDTYQKLITLGDDYANVVSIVDGKLTLNIESLKELTKKKYDDEIATLRLARAEEWHNAVTAGKNGEDTSKYTKIIENIDAEIDAKKRAKDLLDKYDYTTTVSTKKKTDDPWKDQFEKEYNEKQHLLNMNKIDEDEYINWLDGAYKQYFSDLTKYQDEYNKYEEEVYKARSDREQKLFDKKIDNLEKLADKALDSYKDGDGNELTVTASFDYAREQINKAIAETQAKIDGIRNGTISGNTDDIETLIDDLDSLNDKLIDINKKEIESEKDYISELKDDYSDMMDERIKAVEKLSDAVEKSYENEINAIDKKIKAIDKESDAEDRKRKILEAQKKVKEAEKELNKAGIKKYIVLTNNGWEAQADTTDIEEAQKNLDEAKQNLEDALKDEQKAILEDQKDILEEQRDNAKEYYSAQKEALETQKTYQEDVCNTLSDILDKIGGDTKQTESNKALIDKLTKSGDVNAVISKLSETEKQKALESGLITETDSGFELNYSALDKMTNSLNTAFADNTKAINDLAATVSENNDIHKTENNAEQSTDTVTAGGFNLVADPKTGKLTKKQVMVNGEVVEGLGHKVNATSKEEWQEHNNSEKTKKGSFAGYDTFIDFMRAVSAGKVDISPLTNAFNSDYNPIVDKMNKSISDTINNVSNSNVNNNVNNKPAFNCTINIEGNADQKTISAIENKLDERFIEYTDALNKSITLAYNKQKGKR